MAHNSASDGNITSTTTSMVHYTGTKTKVPQEATVSWIIEDVKNGMTSSRPGEVLKTNGFRIKDSKWYCKIWLNGINKDYEGHISVSLWSENDETFKAKFTCGVGKSDHGWLTSVTCQREFTQKGQNVVFPKFLSHEFVMQNEKQLMRNGRMEFIFKVSVVEDGFESPKVSLLEETSEINRLRKLSENFSDLLWDENSSDFQIICGEDIFPVHRIVLKARSSFFQGLFSNDFVESKTGHIVIEDMDSDTVNSLIEYIYTGKFKDLDSRAIPLLKAADKYDLSLLKKSCEDELISTMKLENVVDLFVLAEDHNAEELRVAAKKMILENKTVIVEQDGWDTKLGTLVIELFKAIQSKHFV